MDCAALRVEHERAESDVGMKLTERTIKHARLRQITAGDDGTSLESHCGQLVIHGSNPIGMTNLNFAARELSSGGSTVEKLTVSGHSHLGCGVGGHPACRQVRESDRQDAYLPHSQDGCAPSS